MQTRVVELIPQLQDEGLIEELLVVNDDLNNAFIRYERCGAASLCVLHYVYKKMLVLIVRYASFFVTYFILFVLLLCFRFDRLNKAQMTNTPQVRKMSVHSELSVLLA